MRATTGPVRPRVATRAAPAVSAIAIRPDSAPNSGRGSRRRTASSANCATTAPATTGTTGTFDRAGTMLMPSIVGAPAAVRDQGCPGGRPGFRSHQSRSPWRISCLPASVIEPDSDGYTENV